MYLVGFANLAALLVFIFLTGLTLGVFLVTQATMIADSVDDAERRLGVRNDGISFAGLTFASKIMNALAVLVFGVFVVIAGYEARSDCHARDAEHGLRCDHDRAGRQLPHLVVPFLFYRVGAASVSPVEDRGRDELTAGWLDGCRCQHASPTGGRHCRRGDDLPAGRVPRGHAARCSCSPATAWILPTRPLCSL